MRLKQIRSTVLDHGLDVYGAFHPDADDFSRSSTLILLGPTYNFWDVITASDIYQDEKSDPIDRWSTKVITAIAQDLNARPIFPFGGPPYAPFLSWAKTSGRAWNSPVGMLVHDLTGLMVSYRGALAFDNKLNLPDQIFENPCDTCNDKPCLAACPVDALNSSGYNVPKCHAYMDTNAGATCLTQGCLVRRVCPASVGANRLAEQSALHMRAFRGE
jgi:epoxyqueuosine reductase